MFRFNLKKMSSNKNGEKRSNSQTKPTNTSSSQRQTTSAKAYTNDLLSKEEEYKRLNEELEKKTQNLVFEAEQVLKANEKLLNEADYLNKISEVDFLSEKRITPSKPNKKNVSNLLDANEISSFKRTIMNIESKNEYDDRDEEFRGSTIEDNEPRGSSLEKELSAFYASKDKMDLDPSLMPRAANDMSNEAQIRFLKAKLKVLQEEVERLGGEMNKKDEENLKLAQRCKELDEDRAKQLRISNSHQTQMEKYKKLNDESQVKLQQCETQGQSAKKENEQFKRDIKKYQQDQQQTELKLNRALEEIEKYKVQLQKTQSTSKDSTEQEKKKIDNLQSENKRLQKQKMELVQAFKKQLKLIDILKKQKMHLEAARMLQFSEEEFINALDWNASNQSAANANSVTQKLNSIGSNSNRRPPSGSGSSKAKSAQRDTKNKLVPPVQPTITSRNDEANDENENKYERLDLNYEDDEDYELNNVDYVFDNNLENDDDLETFQFNEK